MTTAQNSGAVLLPIDTTKLWAGCVLATCATGVMIPEYPFILNEQTMIDSVYQTINNDEGEKAVILFSEERLPILGVFQDFHSERTSLVESEEYAMSHFKLAPPDLQELAEAVVQLFLQDVGNQVLPVVTTGFWLDEGKLYSNDSMHDFMIHGGNILQMQVSPFEEAMEYYKVKHSMDDERAQIAERVYREKIAFPDQKVLLHKSEVDIIREQGDIHNMEACESVFNGMGIFFEAE